MYLGLSSLLYPSQFRHVFRPQYSRLGVLRTLFPNTPIMALSATLCPHVLLYTQRALKLNTPTGLIKRSIDRPNIYLHCIPISHSVASRRDLLFLVPPTTTANNIYNLPKTMVFMDSRVAVCETTTMLIRQLPPRFRSADIICDYSTVLSEKRRQVVMERFTQGTCRILVCTEAAGMGVDISDIVRVIQWTIPRHVNLANFWQRAGRCGRNRNISGIAILFYNKVQCIPQGIQHPLDIFCESATGPNVNQILKEIQAFDAGEFGNRKKSENIVTQNDRVFGDGGGYIDDADTGRVVLEQGANETEVITAQYEGGNRDRSRSDVLNTALQEPIPALEENQTANTGSKAHSLNLRSLATLDRGLLWFLSTVGCRRLTVRSYFDDTEISPFSTSQATPVSSCASPSSLRPQDQEPMVHYNPVAGPCCDNCIRAQMDQLSDSISSLLPPPNDNIIAIENQDSTTEGVLDQFADNSNSQQAPRRVRVSAETKNQLHLKLIQFREMLWEKEGLHQPIGMFTNSFFLPDKYLQCLVQACGSITDIEGLAQVLARQKVDLQFSSIGPYAQQLLELITSTVHTSPDAPLPVPTLPAVIPPTPSLPDCEPLAGLGAFCAIDLETHLEGPAALNESDTPHILQGSIPNDTPRAGVRRRRGGRPTAAQKDEQNRLRLLIEAEMKERFQTAQANGTDATRWDLSLLGQRSRGRPTVAEQSARQLAEAGRLELHSALLNKTDFPLLWQQLDETGRRGPGDGNGA